MYLLFRYHHQRPTFVWKMPQGEKRILHAFVVYEQKEREREAKALWPDQ